MANGSPAAEDLGKYSFMKEGGSELAPINTDVVGGVPDDLVKMVEDKKAAMMDGSFSTPVDESAPAGTFWPTATLGAPQTMVSDSPVPTSTSVTRSLSAFGCCTASRISATTMCANGGATGRHSSTSMPESVSSSHSASVVNGGSQNSRSQDSGNCMSLEGVG